MSDGNPQTDNCPSCGAWLGTAGKRCPQCGRPTGPRGFFFYAFWVALSLVVVFLVGYMFYCGFEMLNRML